ncbi:MAG: oxygenase MpaB family protein [Chitinophagaceae bacterium]
MQQTFVAQHSVVRKIWGKADIVLFIFAGAAAEFALNKEVDWLYFTGKLPKDPLGRMFSTVTYAHRIIFMDTDSAHAAIDQINVIHKNVEEKRGQRIPEWAYRDVLYLLIFYSITAFELLERRMTAAEKEEVFTVFAEMGRRMHIGGLPGNYQAWLQQRNAHLHNNLECSIFSSDLFLQYKRQLHPLRYGIMRQVQAWLAPARVRELLLLSRRKSFPALLRLYRVVRGTYTQYCLIPMLIPRPYYQQVYDLNRR